MRTGVPWPVINDTFRAIDTDDDAYAGSVEFALPAYASIRLERVRQAFSGYIGMSRHDRRLAVCGFRNATRGLFREQCLAEPLCAFVARQAGAPVSRTSLVELGSFRTGSTALPPLLASNIERLLPAAGFSYALALSPVHVASVTDWSKQRAAMAIDSPAARAVDPESTALEVCVLPLRGRP